MRQTAAILSLALLLAGCKPEQPAPVYSGAPDFQSRVAAHIEGAPLYELTPRPGVLCYAWQRNFDLSPDSIALSCFAVSQPDLNP